MASCWPVAGSPPARNLPRRNLTVPGRERWITAGRSARPPCPATRPISAEPSRPRTLPAQKTEPRPLVPCCSCRAEPDDPPRHARVATRGLRAAPATGPHQPSDSCTKVHPIGTIAIMANRGGGGVSTKSGRTVSPPRPGCGWRAGPARGARRHRRQPPRPRAAAGGLQLGLQRPPAARPRRALTRGGRP